MQVETTAEPKVFAAEGLARRYQDEIGGMDDGVVDGDDNVQRAIAIDEILSSVMLVTTAFRLRDEKGLLDSLRALSNQVDAHKILFA